MEHIGEPVEDLWWNTLVNLYRGPLVEHQRSSIQVHQCVQPEILYTGSPMCSTSGPLYRFTNVFHQRSSIQVHQCVPPEVLYTGSPVCSTRGPLQVHQCVPSEDLYPGSPVWSTRDPLYRFTSVLEIVLFFSLDAGYQWNTLVNLYSGPLVEHTGEPV
jgi:hypothetical protein